jgi:hypothetical protein
MSACFAFLKNGILKNSGKLELHSVKDKWHFVLVLSLGCLLAACFAALKNGDKAELRSVLKRAACGLGAV